MCRRRKHRLRRRAGGGCKFDNYISLWECFQEEMMMMTADSCHTMHPLDGEIPIALWEDDDEVATCQGHKKLLLQHRNDVMIKFIIALCVCMGGNLLIPFGNQSARQTPFSLDRFPMNTVTNMTCIQCILDFLTRYCDTLEWNEKMFYNQVQKAHSSTCIARSLRSARSTR